MNGRSTRAASENETGMKKDAAAEQKGMSGTTGQIQIQRITHLSQPPNFVLKLSGTQGGSGFIPNHVGGFSIQYQLAVCMALTQYAVSFSQSSRITSITLLTLFS
jgi:hypothetical protein